MLEDITWVLYACVLGLFVVMLCVGIVFGIIGCVYMVRDMNERKGGDCGGSVNDDDCDSDV